MMSSLWLGLRNGSTGEANGRFLTEVAPKNPVNFGVVKLNLVKSCKHLTKKCSASGIDSLFHHRKAGGSVILLRDVLPKGRPKMSFLVGLWPSELVVLLARFRFPMHDASCGAVSPVFLRRSLRGSRLQEHLFESEWKNTTHGGLKHRTCFFYSDSDPNNAYCVNLESWIDQFRFHWDDWMKLQYWFCSVPTFAWRLLVLINS